MRICSLVVSALANFSAIGDGAALVIVNRAGAAFSVVALLGLLVWWCYGERRADMPLAIDVAAEAEPDPGQDRVPRSMIRPTSFEPRSAPGFDRRGR